MLIINYKRLLSFLIMLSFTGIIFTALPAVAGHFEVGTQFGYSHIVPEEKNTSYRIMNSLQFPSGVVFAASSPSAFYFTWFGGEHFAVGMDFAFSRMSIAEEQRWWGRQKNVDFTLFDSGYYLHYYLQSHDDSSPYVKGRFSLGGSDAESLFFDTNAIVAGFGFAVGYQWRFTYQFMLRSEASYRRVWVSYEDADDAEAGNQLSILLSIGTRFGG